MTSNAAADEENRIPLTALEVNKFYPGTVTSFAVSHFHIAKSSNRLPPAGPGQSRFGSGRSEIDCLGSTLPLRR